MVAIDDAIALADDYAANADDMDLEICDINKDGKVSITDVATLVSNFLDDDNAGDNDSGNTDTGSTDAE